MANWIKNAIGNNKGALHRALNVPEGEKISASKLLTALHSSDPHLRKMAQMAKTMKKMN